VLRLSPEAARLLSDGEYPDGRGSGARRARAEYLALRQAGLLSREPEVWSTQEVRKRAFAYTRWPVRGLQLFLAERCNLRCAYCYVGRNHALAGAVMGKDVIRNAIELGLARLGPHRTLSINFFGGEPLLHWEGLQYAVATARRLARRDARRVTFSATTNGTLLDEDTVAYLAQNRFRLTLSWDGPPSVQDRMRRGRGGRGSSEAVLEGYRAAKAAGIPITVRATVSSACWDRSALAAFFEELGETNAYLVFSEPRCGRPGPSDVAPRHRHTLDRTEDALAQRVLESALADTKCINPFVGLWRGLMSRSVFHLPCGFGRSVAIVGVDGRIYPCHRFVGMDAYVIGDVRRGIDRARLRDLIRQYFQVRSHCLRCPAAGRCGLECVWLYADDDGIMRPLPRWRCNMARQSFARAIWLYAEMAQLAPAELAKRLGTRGASATAAATPAAPWRGSGTP